MSAEHDRVYIKGDRNVEVKKKDVTLGDVLEIESSNPTLAIKLKTLKLLKIQDAKSGRYVVSILEIINSIHQNYPAVEVYNMGESDLIITYEEQKTASKVLYLIKTVLVAIITFLGAAFSIMAFHNDISITKLFGNIYEMLTGVKSSGFTILEVFYSIGLTIGILIFFNHFGKKKFTKDPTPMEVQMRLYENDIQTTLVEDASRRGQEKNVDTKDTSGIYWC